MTTVIQIELDSNDVEEILAYLKTLPAVKKGKILIETKEIDKLTHEQIMDLPEHERVVYYKAHGGIFNVMEDNKHALTQKQIDDWNKQKEEEEAEWAVEYKRRYGKDLPS